MISRLATVLVAIGLISLACFGAAQEIARVPFACGTELSNTSRKSKGLGYSAFGPKSALIIRVDFADAPGEAIGISQATNVMAQVDAFYRATSFRQFSIPQVAVTPVLRLNGEARNYAANPGQIAFSARAAAQSAGLNPDTYDFLIYTFPSIGFPYSGYGIIGGKGIWIPGIDFIPSIVAHEIGHNLGLLHACSWTTSDDSIIGFGSAWDYGNSFDAMGNSPYFPDSGFNGNYRYLLGWLADSDIQVAGSNGTYRIYAIDNNDGIEWGRHYALRVPAGATFGGMPCDYWLDYRAAYTYPAFLNGAVIQAATASPRLFGNLLLDMVPGTDGQSDAALLVGRTFADKDRRIFITPVDVDAKNRRHIDVVVNRDVISNSLPSLAISATALEISLRQTIAFSASASDPENDDLAYSWSFGDGTIPLQLNSAQVSKAWGFPGVYPVQCVVSDMKGGVAIKTLVVQVGQPTNFWVSGRVLAGTNPVSAARVTSVNSLGFRNNASTDDDGFYLLPGLGPETVTVNAVKAGFSFATQSISPGASATNIDFGAILPPPKPGIISVTPSSARVGETISIAGTNLLGSTYVRISNVSATFAVVSPTEIIAVVPPGAVSGTIFVTTGSAVVNSGFFTVLTGSGGNAPAIAGFDPQHGAVDSLVRISGANLIGTTGVRFGSIPAEFYVMTSSEIVAVVPPGASTAGITVATTQGVVVAGSPFVVNAAQPETNIVPSIVSFSPRYGSVTERVRIIGDHLDATTNVAFGAVRAPFNVVSAREVWATVASDTVTAPILIETTNGSAASRDLFLFDLPRPTTIVVDPVDGTVSEGEPWTFSVSAFGSGLLHYQWRNGTGSSLPGETNSTLVISNATPDRAGFYYATVTGLGGSRNSRIATLNVLTIADALGNSNLVWRSSADARWLAQSDFHLDLPTAAESAPGLRDSWMDTVITGPARLSFWWQLATTKFSDALELSVDGTNAMRLMGPNPWTQSAIELGAGDHVVRWTRRASSSATARLTEVSVDRVWIVRQPASTNALAGAGVLLSAQVAGSGSAQWLRNDVPLPGATNLALGLGPISITDSGDYVLTISNLNTFVRSAIARVNVAPVVVAEDPRDQSVVATSNATFSVAYRSLSPVAFQWLFGAVPIPGATNASLVFRAMPPDAGQYRVIITNNFGAVTSSPAALAVPALSPRISNDVVDYFAIAGDDLLLPSEAAAIPPPVFVWKRNGRRIANALAASLLLRSIRPAQAGLYVAIATNAFGSVTQRFRVKIQQTFVTEQPNDQTVFAGDSFAIRVNARSTAPLRYQWRLNGRALPGQTNSVLSFAAARASDAGLYDVLIRSRRGRATSRLAQVNVLTSPPVFLLSPSNEVSRPDEPVRLQVLADGHPHPRYQWYHNDMPIDGGNSPQLLLAALKKEAEGSYYAVASNEVGTAVSGVAVVAIQQQPPSPRIAPGDFSTVAGNWVALRSSRAISPPPLDLFWTKDGLAIPGATNAIHLLSAVSAADGGKYRIAVSNELGQGTSSGTDIYVRMPGKLDSWERRAPASCPENLRAVVFGNSTFVASGESGTILAANDGLNWRDVSLLTTATVSSVAFAADRFMVLVDDGERPGVIVTSSNAIDWKSGSMPAAVAFYSVGSANDRFFVGGQISQSNLLIATSKDGVEWIHSYLPYPAGPLSVAFGEGTYVATCLSNVFTSADATNWIRSAELDCRGIEFGAGVFVAVGSGGRIWTSKDGIRWSARNSGTGKDLNAVRFRSAGFVAVGEDGVLLTSLDGASWSDAKPVVSFNLASAVVAGDRFVAVGDAGSIITSSGFGSWQGVDTLSSREAINGIAFTNDTLVAVGDAGLILTSLDGRAWSRRDSRTGKDLVSVTVGAAGFVAVGEDGRIVSSPNGVSWTLVGSPVAENLQRIEYLDGRYFAVGDQGVMVVSTNGRNWVARQISLPERDEATLGGIALENGLFVVAGGYRNSSGSAHSFFAVSHDAESWSELDEDFRIKLRGISSSGGQFVAFGNDGAIAVSQDGLRWRHQFVANEGDNVRAVASLPDGTWVAVGNSGLVFSSTDTASSWMRNRLFTSKNIHALALARDSLFAVGSDGLIVVSQGLSPKLSPARVGPGSSLRLDVDMGSRNFYMLQESEDLHEWRDLRSLTSGGPSNLFFNVTNAPARRFFRLRAP